MLHLGPGFVDEAEVVLLQFGVPACLSMVELLGLLEVRQVLVVRPDLEGVHGSQQVRPPILKRPHDSQELSVVDLVVPLSGGECL